MLDMLLALAAACDGRLDLGLGKRHRQPLIARTGASAEVNFRQIPMRKSAGNK